MRLVASGRLNKLEYRVMRSYDEKIVQLEVWSDQKDDWVVVPQKFNTIEQAFERLDKIVFPKPPRRKDGSLLR